MKVWATMSILEFGDNGGNRELWTGKPECIDGEWSSNRFQPILFLCDCGHGPILDALFPTDMQPGECREFELRRLGEA